MSAIPTARFIDAVKWVKQMGNVLGTNADAGILHRQRQPIAIPCRDELHRPADPPRASPPPPPAPRQFRLTPPQRRFCPATPPPPAGHPPHPPPRPPP